MQLLPDTPAFEQFLTDNLGSDYEDAAKEDLLADMHSCMICGHLFTSAQDFEPDARDVFGEWVCNDCDALGSHDPVGKDGF